MTQAVTSEPVTRETDHSHRERLAQRLAVLVILGLTTAACAGAGAPQQSQRGDDVPFWHEEDQMQDNDPGSQ